MAIPKLLAKEKGAYEGYPYVELPDPQPLRPLRVPLAQARVALVSSGGLSVPGQEPFDAASLEGDPRVGIIPGPGPLPVWRIDHGHYDPTAATQDYNTVFPIDPLRALVEAGGVGSLAPRHIAFHGFQADAAAVLGTIAPAIAAPLLADAVDAALLVPV